MNPEVYFAIVGVAIGLAWMFRVWSSSRANASFASAAAFGLYQRGDFVSAEKAFRELVKVCERSHGPEHALTVSNRNHLANCLTALGRSEEAVAGLEQMLAIRMRLLGVDHVDTISTRNNLATALHALGNMGEAEKQFRKVLSARERLVGVESSDVLKTCYALALSLEEQSRNEEAVTFARRCEDGWMKTLGASHPATVRARMTRERIEAVAVRWL